MGLGLGLGFRVAGLRVRVGVTAYGVRGTGHGLRVTGFGVRVTGQGSRRLAWAGEGKSEQSGGQRRARSASAAPWRERWLGLALGLGSP